MCDANCIIAIYNGYNNCNLFLHQIAWALNKGIKAEYKQYWDVEQGVTYIPWIKTKAEDLEGFKEGGMLDPDSLSPGNLAN